MNESFYVTSNITNEKYDVFACVKLLNLQQCIYYLKRGVKLRDLKISEDRKTGLPCLVFYFYRDDTKEAYDEWCGRRAGE